MTVLLKIIQSVSVAQITVNPQTMDNQSLDTFPSESPPIPKLLSSEGSRTNSSSSTFGVRPFLTLLKLTEGSKEYLCIQVNNYISI